MYGSGHLFPPAGHVRDRQTGLLSLQLSLQRRQSRGSRSFAGWMLLAMPSSHIVGVELIP